MLFSTLTPGDAFVSNRKVAWGREMRGEDRKHSADQMNPKIIIKSLAARRPQPHGHSDTQAEVYFVTPWDTNIVAPK